MNDKTMDTMVLIIAITLGAMGVIAALVNQDIDRMINTLPFLALACQTSRLLIPGSWHETER